MLIESTTVGIEHLDSLVAAGTLYAVLDACDTPAVPARAAGIGAERATSLYGGTAHDQYWSIAPYLFRVDQETLSWIVEELWTEPWGIFAVVEMEFEEVRRHFKKFLVVQAPDGEPWYFRFYDPRVLPVFLRNCTGAELAEFFGLLRAFGVGTHAQPAVTLLELGPADGGRPPIRIRRRAPTQHPG